VIVVVGLERGRKMLTIWSRLGKLKQWDCVVVVLGVVWKRLVRRSFSSFDVLVSVSK